MAQLIVLAEASGAVLVSPEGVSFWGGVDPDSGVVVDAHHPLRGQSVAGKVLLMPTSRGSCSGSGVLLQLALNGCAPAALVFREAEDVLTLGAVIAGEMFDKPLPVLRLGASDYARLAGARKARITPDRLCVDDWSLPLSAGSAEPMELRVQDRAMYDGAEGPAVQLAMQIPCTMARAQGATSLIDVTPAHIDTALIPL